MVLFIGYHATSPAYRDRIARRGLRPWGRERQRYGVYLFTPYMLNDLATAAMGEWWHGPGQDLWRAAYCGPMVPDPWVRNAVILPDWTPVTLVTGNVV